MCHTRGLAPMTRVCLQQGPVAVPGLDTHLKTMERAKQLEAEQQEREDRVFHRHPKPRSEPFTVPQPFALRTQLREVGTSMLLLLSLAVWHACDIKNLHVRGVGLQLTEACWNRRTRLAGGCS